MLAIKRPTIIVNGDAIGVTIEKANLEACNLGLEDRVIVWLPERKMIVRYQAELVKTGGNSIGVIFPKDLTDMIGLEPGVEIDIDLPCLDPDRNRLIEFDKKNRARAAEK